METGVFKFFLLSGGREGEVARLEWHDLDMRDKKVGFVSREGASTKNRKTRFVPLPARMITVLKDHQKVIRELSLRVSQPDWWYRGSLATSPPETGSPSRFELRSV
jgi:integrase